MKTKHYFGVLAAVVAALLFTSMPLHAFEKPNTVKVLGEIALINVKLGTLRLEADAARNRRDPIEFRINRNNTRVTDPSDKKFLKLEDLRVGQRVTVEFYHNQGEWEQVPVAQKIIANPAAEAAVQETSPQGSTSTVTTTTTNTTTTQ